MKTYILILNLIVISLILTPYNMIANNRDFKEMIEAAIKAPSGHNTQPWKFKMFEDRIEIIPDYTKTLDIVDANNRELFISLGCATENLTIAASNLGYESILEIANTGDIKIHLNKSDILADPLFTEIDKRQTNRNVYESKIIADNILQRCLQVMPKEDKIHIYSWQNSSTQFDTLAKYIMEGNIRQLEDQNFKDELKSWMRYNNKSAESTNDGLSYDVFGAPNLPQFISKPIMSSFLNSKKQNKTDKAKIESSSHFILFTTTDNDVQTWIRLGMYMERFILNLTKENIVHSYINQPCEVEELRNNLSKELFLNNETPQILLRIGYGKAAAYSRRKSIDEVIHRVMRQRKSFL